jgi:hypothetical protein
MSDGFVDLLDDFNNLEEHRTNAKLLEWTLTGGCIVQNFA